MNIDPDDAKGIVAVFEGDGGAPGSNTRPGERIRNAVERDRFYVHWRGTGHISDVIGKRNGGIHREAGRVFGRELSGDAVVRRGEPRFYIGRVLRIDAA